MSKKIQILSGIFLSGILILSVFYFIYDNQISDENIGGIKKTGALAQLAQGVATGNKTFLVLLQNNMELRPGGGFIGSFAIIKTENGRIKSYEVHDTANFDGRIPENTEMPEPMKKIFRIESWKLRDSNYSPDFPTNAQKALKFYYQGQGQEKFDGVVAVNADVLKKFLEVTGPIRLEGYPNVFEAENVLVTLEKQVEIDYAKQGIAAGDRKDVMGDFLRELLKKTAELPKLDKLNLANKLVSELENKNIQLYFGDEKLNTLVEESNWGGRVDEAWSGDYLLVADANLGAYKSDYFIKRSMEYTVDMSRGIPEATLKITYQHTGQVKDWMTRDYLSYLRVYLPKGAKINETSEVGEVTYSEDLNKKVMGGFVEVPLNSTKTVIIKYTLPQELKEKDYQLKIQKQSGSGVVPMKVDVKSANGEDKTFELNLNGDRVVK